MKQFLIAILCFFMLTSISSSRMTVMIAGGGAPAPAGQSIDYTQDFEGGSPPDANWTTGDSENYEKSTDGLDMESDECLEIPPGTDVTYDPSFNTPEEYFTFYYRFSEAEDAEKNMIYISSAGGAENICRIRHMDDETLQCDNGGSDDKGDKTYTAGVRYKLRIRAKTGTGANGICTLDWWTGSEWTEDCTSTNGTSTANIDYIQFRNLQSNMTLHFDYLQVNTTAIVDPQ